MTLITSDEPLRYDGQLVDDEPLRQIVLSTSWRSFVVAIADYLRQRELWHNDDDVDAAVAQADACIALLLGEEMPPVYEYPITACFMWAEAWFNTGASKLYAAYSSSYAFGVAWYPASAANGDAYDFYVNLAQGVRYLRLIGHKSSNLGKTEIYIDGSLISGSLFDWYSATIAYNQEQRIAVTFTGDMRHHIQIRVNGKHASSSDYFTIISAMLIEQNQA